MSDQRFNGVIHEYYDAAMRATIPHFDEVQGEVSKVIGEFARAKAGFALRVVEGGTGTGVTTACLLQAAPDLHVTTVDNERLMQEQAKTALKHSSRRIRFVERDLVEYLQQCPDNSFDVFVSAYTLHNFDPAARRDLMQEIHRVLAPEGIFVNADKLAVDDLTEHRHMLAGLIRGFDVLDEQGLSELKHGWIEHCQADELIRFGEQEQKDILSSSGFGAVATVYRKHMEAIVVARRMPVLPAATL